MNRFKFEAFKQEFPALQSLLLNRNQQPREARHCDSIQVKRLDRNCLYSTPIYNSWDGSMVSISKKETVSFVLADGSLIQDAVYQAGQNNEGETILEAIQRHEIANKISLVIVVSTGFVVREHYSEPNYSVVIYKAAKGECLTKLIAENAALNAAEVRAEANF